MLRRWSKKELCESGLVAGQRRLWEEQMGTVVMAAIRIPHLLLRHPWRPLPWAFLLVATGPGTLEQTLLSGATVW